MVTAGSRDGERAAALGCRAHTGWAALVVVAGGFARPEVLLRGRAELGDPAGHVRRNVYQAARGLEPAEAAALVEAAERIAAEQAAEGQLYQGALLQSAESRGLDTIAIPKRSIWEQAESALGVAEDELRDWI